MPKEISIAERGAQIYDELMEYLGASELKIENIDTLEEKYADDTPLDRADRLERYEAIFTEAKRLLDLRQLGQEIDMHKYLKEKRAEVLEKETIERSEDITEAESQLESFEDDE